MDFFYFDTIEMIDLIECFDYNMKYFGEKKYQKAKVKFEKLLEKHPQDVDAYNILGHT